MLQSQRAQLFSLLLRPRRSSPKRVLRATLRKNAFLSQWDSLPPRRVLHTTANIVVREAWLKFRARLHLILAKRQASLLLD